MTGVIGLRVRHNGWIGVDLDGTLARNDEGIAVNEGIGSPIPAMVARVKLWLEQGWEVRVVTARVSTNLPKTYRDHQQRLICAWTEEVFGTFLYATSEKDFGMLELWDDRARRVETNTGRVLE